MFDTFEKERLTINNKMTVEEANPVRSILKKGKEEKKMEI